MLEDLDVRQAAPSSSSALTHTPIHMQELMGAGVTPGEESDDAFDSQYLGLRPNGHGSHSFVGRGAWPAMPARDASAPYSPLAGCACGP